jgi:hypothetical protein
MVAGAGSTGGILAVYIGRCRGFFGTHRPDISVVRVERAREK